MQLEFLEAPRDLPGLESSSIELDKLPASPKHHVGYRGVFVSGIAHAPAYSGYLVVPARTVLALPGFEDAHEFVHDDAVHTIFDIEKVVRMLLHGSHLAFETLASSSGPVRDEMARTVLEWTLNQRHLAASRDSMRAVAMEAAAELQVGDALDHLRRALQGAALSRGRVGLHLDSLLGFVGIDAPDLKRLAQDDSKIAQTVDDATLERIREICSTLEFGEELPDTPTDYDALSGWLVEARLETV